MTDQDQQLLTLHGQAEQVVFRWNPSPYLFEIQLDKIYPELHIYIPWPKNPLLEICPEEVIRNGHIHKQGLLYSSIWSVKTRNSQKFQRKN